ncbi:MAG: hypothetical protein M3463_23340 [Verrucomicrobiota bacterium]|nr:hypothetical protein [Verrucomicrobiota bacterium]
MRMRAANLHISRSRRDEHSPGSALVPSAGSGVLAAAPASENTHFPTVTKATIVEASFTFQGHTYRTEITPATLKDSAGIARMVFPGGREQLVEQALRYLAVQNIAKTHITSASGHSLYCVTTLSQLRRVLGTWGHEFKIAEIQQAIDILAGTQISLLYDQPGGGRSGRQRVRKIRANILTQSINDAVMDRGDLERASVAVAFHPLATKAILAMAFWPINVLRVARLKSPLARWLTMRLSHNFRNVERPTILDPGLGYHIRLSTILEERGTQRETRVRACVEKVRHALREMAENDILNRLKPFEEELRKKKAGKTLAIEDALWTLFPSKTFAEEIIDGNAAMVSTKSLRQKLNPEVDLPLDEDSK